MLPKRRRLTTPEVAEVLKAGRSRRATYLTMKFLPLQTPLKTSAVVAKAVARGAVERNRLRRAVYRALSSPAQEQVGLTRHGHAVLFVQKVPKEDLARVFAEDVAILFKNTI